MRNFNKEIAHDVTHDYGILTSLVTDVLQIPINMCRTRTEGVGVAAHVTSGEKFPIKSRCRDLRRHGGGKRPIAATSFRAEMNVADRFFLRERRRERKWSLFWDTRSVSDYLYSRYRKAAESESQRSGSATSQLFTDHPKLRPRLYPTLIKQLN